MGNKYYFIKPVSIFNLKKKLNNDLLFKNWNRFYKIINYYIISFFSKLFYGNIATM